MAKRVGKHLRGNVVAYVALFFALGMGTAWALERNSVRSKHIVNGQVKERDTRSGHFAPGPRDCPNRTQFVEAVCVETSVRPTNRRVGIAMGECQADDRRLPSASELLSLHLLGFRIGRPGGFDHELTNDVSLDLNGTSITTWVLTPANNGFADGFVGDGDQRPFRCVALP